MLNRIGFNSMANRLSFKGASTSFYPDEYTNLLVEAHEKAKSGTEVGILQDRKREPYPYILLWDDERPDLTNIKNRWRDAQNAGHEFSPLVIMKKFEAEA